MDVDGVCGVWVRVRPVLGRSLLLHEVLAQLLTNPGASGTVDASRCNMSRLEELEAFLEELKGTDRALARTNFAALFQTGCRLLELDDEAAARVFDTSRPTINRWRRGKMSPPVAWLILRFMGEQVAERIRGINRAGRANNARKFKAI